MKIQELVSDVRSRFGTAGKNYQNAFFAYIDTQRKALGVVTRNGQSLAGTEIGAAKNVFAAARASFDKARNDGVRKVANNPQAYVPNGRDQIVCAYKDTIDVLVRTGNELTDVVSDGYKSVRAKLTGDTRQPVQKRAASSRSKKASNGSGKPSSGTAKKTATAGKSTAKRKTAATRSASAKAESTNTATATARKRNTTQSATTTTSNPASDSTS